MAKKGTKRAEEIVDHMIGDDEGLRGAVEAESIHSHVASLIFEARIKAGLTQERLAELVATQQSVIARLESADYEGHSLSMLVRIAEALDNRIEINLVPRSGSRRTA